MNDFIAQQRRIRALRQKQAHCRHDYEQDWGAGYRRSRTGLELVQQRCTKCDKVRRVYAHNGKPCSS